MQGFYYITAAMVLVLGGLGIYSSQAGPKVVSEPEGVIVMEEVVYTVSPKRQNQPTKATDINAMKNNNSKGGFMPLPEDKGVEVAPVPEENPKLESAPEENVSVEEKVMETMD